MNNRFLFRGKRKDNGEWVVGHYVCYGSAEPQATHHIIHNQNNMNRLIGLNYEVDPETVGQCTGLKDTNGKLIFEGDIVNMHQFLFDGSEYDHEIQGTIGYSNGFMAFTLDRPQSKKSLHWQGFEEEFEDGWVPTSTPINAFIGLHEESWTVVGNIHDNPELLTEQKNNAY